MTVRTNWANRTKEAVANTTPTIPAGMVARSGSGLESVVAYYKFKEPKVPNALTRVLSAGSTFEGTYEGRFASQMYPENFTYKIRTAEGVIGLPHCTQLGQDLKDLPNGTKVFVAYKGQESVKQGIYAGKLRHAFLVASEPVIEVDPNIKF